MDEVRSLYEDLHRHPELSGGEERTAAAFARFLTATGLDVTTGVGGHGVVGRLTAGDGPTVLLRAELDALPVREETGLRYASAVPGVMHACGHDLHLAALAGAAAELARDRSAWRGTVLVVAQPAEETLTGAAALLADGLYERFGRPGVVLAQHTVPLPAGMVAHAGFGPVFAGSATFRITVPGRGGHAAVPHLCVDPVVVAASIVVQLQTVVSRTVGPSDAAVLNVGRLSAGDQANVIPDTAVLEVTIRAQQESTVDRMVGRMLAIVRAQCASFDCPAEPKVEDLGRSPAVLPDPGVNAAVRAAHERRFGAGRIAWWPPAMATEDVALLARDGIRLGYWVLGTVGPQDWAAAPGSAAAEKLTALPGNHSARFAPHAAIALPTGVAALVSAAKAHLGPADGQAP